MSSSLCDPRVLLPNPWNTNRMTPEAELKLRLSIERNGMFKPILVRQTDLGLQILGGQHRAEQSALAGLAQVPVWNLGEIDEAKAKEIGVIDNARYGFDDAEGLNNLLRELGSAEELAVFLPFDMADLATMDATSKINLDDLGLGEEDDAAVDPPQSKVAKAHALMRFKVPLADQSTVEGIINQIIADHGLEDSDSLVNAGDALVTLIRERGLREQEA